MPFINEALEKAARDHQNGDLQQAEVQYQRILQSVPNQSEALHGLGIIAYQLNQFDKAIRFIEKAIENNPGIPHFYYNAGLVLIALENQDKAINAFLQAIKIKPDYADAYFNLALAQKGLGRFENAIENFKSALRLDPENADAYYNLGNIYKILDQQEAAIVNYRQAIKHKPRFSKAYNNLGLVFKEQGRLNEAIDHYRQAVQLRPDFAEAHWNLSLALLLSGEFKEGWKEHEWRFRRPKKGKVYPYSFGIPPWDGSSLGGKRIFVHSEQGLGDTLQFIRFLPMLKNSGGRVVFETFGQLLGILKGFPGIDELVEISPKRDYAEKCDYYLPLMSLPNIFGTTIETIPSNLPYIFADPLKVRQWEERINEKGFKVGIVWAGKPEHENDHNRSCPLEYFEPLATIPGVKLFGLQKGEAAGQAEKSSFGTSLINFDTELKDFSDTAGAIECLELLISADTAAAHLAGAMGKPVWTLLPFAPDWRWLLDRKDSPWYPSMRLLRQPRPGDWKSVFGLVSRELSVLACSAGAK